MDELIIIPRYNSPGVFISSPPVETQFAVLGVGMLNALNTGTSYQLPGGAFVND